MPDIHALAELFGLARHVNALTLRVVEPSVITAAQPFLLDAAPLEAGAAVRTMRLERTDAPLLVTEDREMLRHVAGALTGLASIGCGLASPVLAQAPQRRREVVVNGKRVRTVDLHAHCHVPEANALMGLKVQLQ